MISVNSQGDDYTPYSLIKTRHKEKINAKSDNNHQNSSKLLSTLVTNTVDEKYTGTNRFFFLCP